MPIFNIHDAKTHFSQLVKNALNGDEIIIANSGEPLIKFTPYEKRKSPRKGGQLKGILIISDDFDDPLPNEYLKGFYGESEA